MAAKQISNEQNYCLLEGSPSDPRLLHSDPSDSILVYPAHLADGYRQEIQLQDNLSLAIVNYEITGQVSPVMRKKRAYIKFEFPVAQKAAQKATQKTAKGDSQYSNFIPNVAGREVLEGYVGKRVFEVEVVFKRSAMATYFQAYVDRMSVRSQQIIKKIFPFLPQYELHRSYKSADTLGKLTTEVTLKDGYPSGNLLWEYLLPEDLYAETLDLHYASRSLITLQMKKIIDQILACPYKGPIRRAYLEKKALELVALRLDAVIRPQLSAVDLQYTYQAAAILRHTLNNPQTIEALARQTSTNRFKLHRSFHTVYGTTPYGYLRDVRFIQARRLLVTSELPVEKVAAAVGYRSRNHFAKAFRQQMGLNPKTFQLRSRQISAV